MTAVMKADGLIRTQSNPSCSMCGSPGVRAYSGIPDNIFGAPGEWNLSRCSNADCRFVWLDPQPLEDDIHQAYVTYYTHGEATEAKNLKARFLSASLRALVEFVTSVSGLAQERKNISGMHLNGLPPGRLLDVGCGDGKFLHRMNGRGWSVAGIDFDQQAARAAKEKYGVDVRVGRLEEMGYSDNSFDAVTMHHVIEHVFDPVATLREVARILKPGGLVVAVTPNSDSLGLRTYGRNWRGLEVPRHIQVFSPQSLETAARKAGLESVQVYSSAANAWAVLSDSMRLAAQQPGTLGKRQRPSIAMLLKALAMNVQEARMNARTRRDGEENVLRARKVRVTI